MTNKMVDDTNERTPPQASTSKIMYSPALSEADKSVTQELLDSLYNFGKGPESDTKLSKLLKHTDHAVAKDESDDTYTLTSWKMQDYAYKQDPCPYPTRARGLFTIGKDRIVARAYDKFFNVDEVSWTKWANLPDLTTAPYYLTLKSNGCLILVAAISPTQLLVTSKHAIGKNIQMEGLSHAQVGEAWLDRGLKKARKSRADLAERLWKENWTLVTELCDDSFEEHILPYAEDKSGLHLHGIVFNHPTLLTLPPPEVNEVASQYGFIETPYTVLNSVDEIKKLRQSVIDNGGMWNGEHVEGFVVRAALKPGSLAKQPHPNDLTEDNWSDKRRVFMWKIKSDEPYLMWREWRETTKKILTEKKKTGDDVAQRGKAKLAGSNKGKQPAEKKVETGKETGLEEAFSKACTNAFKSGGKASSSSKKSSAVIDETEDEPVQEQTEELSSRKKGKKGQSALVDLPSAIRTDRIRNPETRLYAIWVEKYMETHPEEFIEYQENRGIIAVRKAFEEWRATSAGKDMATKVLGEKATSAKSKTGAFERTLIVPIAVPGCGKTALSVALSHLFGFARIESDDIKEKKAAKHFEAKVAKLLKENAVVIADKNNHLKQHRQAMVDIAAKNPDKTRLIAMVWPMSKHPQNEIQRICLDRITGRGENHQSLRPVKTGEHEIILMRFFGQMDTFDPAFNPCDGPFDEIIEMDVAWSLEDSLDYVVENLVKIDTMEGGIKGIQGKRPTKEQMQIAVAKAKGYKPSVYKEMNLEGFDKSKGIRYYGIAVEADLPNLLEGYFSEHPEHRSLYDQLKASKRIETRPHVTLVHEKERNAETTDEASSSGTEFARMLWDKCETLTQRWGTAAVDVKLTLGPLLCWDSRVMSIQVSHVEYSGAGLKREDMPNDDRKGSYHITIGTLSSEIRPVEGKLLLESATQGEIESAEGGVIVTAQVPCVEVTGRIRGLW